MHIAIATSAESKPWYTDMDLLISAINNLGGQAETVIWDNPDVRWADYTAVLIDSAWDYVDRYEEFMAWCEMVQSVSVLMNDLDSVKISSTKHYLLKLQKNGIKTPVTSMLDKNSKHTQPDAYKGKIVIKPLIGAGGDQTFLFNSYEDAMKSQDLQKMLNQTAVLVQDFIPEIQTMGEYGAVFINGKLSHTVIKKPGRNDFRVQHDYGGLSTLSPAPKYVQEYYDTVIATLDCEPLYARLDFIDTPTPTLMEVEMIEPDKFLSLYPRAAYSLAAAIMLRDGSL